MPARLIDLDPPQRRSLTMPLTALLLALAIGGAIGYGLGLDAAEAAPAPEPIISDDGRSELINQLLDDRIQTCDDPLRAWTQAEYCAGVGDWR